MRIDPKGRLYDANVYIQELDVYACSMSRSRRRPKVTKSARLDAAQLARVRRFLGARTDSQAISLAVERADRGRVLHQLIEEHGGKLRPEHWEDIDWPESG